MQQATWLCQVSVFETNIRVVGGLLSAHHLAQKQVDGARVLLLAHESFPSLTGVAHSWARSAPQCSAVCPQCVFLRRGGHVRDCMRASVRAAFVHLCHQSQGTRGRCCGKRPIWPTGCSPRLTRRRASLSARSTCALACRTTSPPRRPSLAPARSVSAHGRLACAPPRSVAS